MMRWRTPLALLVLVLLGPLACYVPPDDGIADGGRDGRAQDDAGSEPAEAQGQAAQGQSPQREQDPEPEQGGWWSQPQPQPDARQETRGGADEVAALAQRAREAYEGREYDRAVQHLEQALEAAPERAVLWQNLAAVRYQQGHYQRAEELALRAVDTGDDDLAVMREAWWLVAAARMERGDRSGARDAASSARRFGEAGDGGLGGI